MLRERVRKLMAVGPPDPSRHSFELNSYTDVSQMDMDISSCVSNLQKELPRFIPHLTCSSLSFTLWWTPCTH